MVPGNRRKTSRGAKRTDDTAVTGQPIFLRKVVVTIRTAASGLNGSTSYSYVAEPRRCDALLSVRIVPVSWKPADVRESAIQSTDILVKRTAVARGEQVNSYRSPESFKNTRR